MGDFWSGTTPYDDNQGKRDARDAEVARQARAEIDQKMQNTLNNPGQNFDVYGSNDQVANIQANLSQVGAMTGQNIFQTGQQQQDYYNSLQNRRNGNDAVAAEMKNQRGKNQAIVGRQLAGKGISGGAGADAMLQASRTSDQSINKQKQDFGRQNDSDLWNYVKRNQKVTGEALAMGEDQGLAAGMDTSKAEGTLACFIFVSMGLMSPELYAKEAGILKEIDPIVLTTYRNISNAVGPAIRKKPIARAIAPMAVAWAEERTRLRPNLLGKIIKNIGEPLLKVIGVLRG